MAKQAPTIDIDESRELAEMMSAYTEVTERLRDSHAKLAAEVAALRDELASKNRELQRRNRLAALGEMAAGIAHEIRNPLGGIALYAGLLNKQLVDRPKSRAISERIAGGVDRLNGIVTDVLAFAGDVRPQCRRTTLSAVVAAAEDLARGRLQAAGTKLTRHIDGDVVLEVDHMLIVRAVSNLLYNAIDAAESGEVRLTAGDEGDNIMIEICDSGVGVDAEVVDKIFNPFFTTKGSGTGLGLAIVHRIVESHGGSVHVSNAKAPDGLGGARFRMVLPKQQ